MLCKYYYKRTIYNQVSGQVKPKTYKSSICCFSTEHAALRGKSKDWLARNKDNVSEWSDMSTSERL